MSARTDVGIALALIEQAIKPFGGKLGVATGYTLVGESARCDLKVAIDLKALREYTARSGGGKSPGPDRIPPDRSAEIARILAERGFITHKAGSVIYKPLWDSPRGRVYTVEIEAEESPLEGIDNA